MHMKALSCSSLGFSPCELSGCADMNTLKNRTVEDIHHFWRERHTNRKQRD